MSLSTLLPHRGCHDVTTNYHQSSTNEADPRRVCRGRTKQPVQQGARVQCLPEQYRCCGCLTEAVVMSLLPTTYHQSSTNGADPRRVCRGPTKQLAQQGARSALLTRPMLLLLLPHRPLNLCRTLPNHSRPVSDRSKTA